MGVLAGRRALRGAAILFSLALFWVAPGGAPAQAARREPRAWQTREVSGAQFSGRFHSLDRGSSILIAAPHGSYDLESDRIARRVCELSRLGPDGLVSEGFIEGGVRINVNRPTEGARQSCASEAFTSRARDVYSFYRRELEQRLDARRLRTLVEIHGFVREPGSPGSATIEIAAVGLSFEEAQAVRDAFLRARSGYSSRIRAARVLVQGIDPIRMGAACTKRYGSLGLVSRGLHLEISRELRVSEGGETGVADETAAYVAQALDSLGPLLIR